MAVTKLDPDLIDGATSAGVALLSAADAAAQLGLLQAGRYLTATGSRTILASERDYILRKTGSAATWALQAAATMGAGWRAKIRVEDNDLTIDPTGAETIDAADTLIVPAGTTIDIYCDGSAFYTSQSISSGLWTPVFTFATPGNLAVSYSSQVGKWSKVGRRVTADFSVITSTFTHTTASGVARITGLPFACGDIGNSGTMEWQGITKASYTQVVPKAAAAATVVTLLASGSGQAVATLAAADFPTGGSVRLVGSLSYMI